MIPKMNTQFERCFRLVVANTPQLRQEVYKIRYKVYSQELGYEREQDCQNGMEQDIYDQRSIHCLLMHRLSNLYAGCVRLVLPELHRAEVNLPFEQVVGSTWKSHNIELRNLPHHSFGEVSRLAVTAEFRKRSGEWQMAQGLSAQQRQALENDKRYFPLIALGLYLAATSIVQEVGLDSAFTLMEPRLARHLKRFGIDCRQSSELVEFHGQRGLFHVSLSAVLQDISADTFDLFQLLRSDIKKSLNLFAPHLHRRAA